jgi:hypothetical protein
MFKFEERLGYDGDEQIYFDRRKPVDVDGVTRFEECDPVEVCGELQAALEKIIDRIPSTWAHEVVRKALPSPETKERVG